MNLELDFKQSQSHVDRIYDYLKKGYSITPKDAADLFGCRSLSQTIGRIKHKYGVEIEAPLVKMGNAMVSRYKIG